MGSWHGVPKSESENLGGNRIFENTVRENNFEVEEVGRENSVIWNTKYSDSINVDLNHTDLNLPIPDNLTKTGSIHDSHNIHEIEKIFSSPVQFLHTPYTAPASQIFTYGTESDPQTPSNE